MSNDRNSVRVEHHEDGRITMMGHGAGRFRLVVDLLASTGRTGEVLVVDEVSGDVVIRAALPSSPSDITE